MMKKALCALLCALLLLALPFAAGAEAEEGASWSLEGNVLSISGEIEAAEAYPWADAADSVTTLRISDGVTEIPAGAFRNFTALQYLTIPKSLRYIGDSAFEGCALLRWVRMPDGLIGIGERAFSGCSKLSAVYLPESVAWIGDNAFDSKIVLNCYANSAGQDYIADNGGTYRQTGTHTLADAKGTWGKSGTWTLENGILTLSGSGDVTGDANGRYPWDAYRADIESVELGEGITSLGKDAFALCRKLTKLVFPKSIETVDEDVLDGKAEIVGYAGTAAETFAEDRGLTFTAIGSDEEPEETAPAETQTAASEPESTEETVPAETEATEETAAQPEATEETLNSEAEETVPAETETEITSTEPEAEVTEASETEPESQTEPTETEAGAQTTPTETQETTAPTEETTEEPEKEPVLSVANVTAQPGQTVQLTVSLSDNPGLCGLYFGIEYDHSKLTLEDYSCINAEFAQEDWMVGVGQEERAVWLQPDRTEAEGEILTLTFQVASDAETGDVAVSLTDIAGVDDQANSVRIAGNAGGVTVALGIPGDINGDGKVTSADLLRLRRYLAGQAVTAETGNADMNGDGRVDLVDLMLLQMLLTGK